MAPRMDPRTFSRFATFLEVSVMRMRCTLLDSLFFAGAGRRGSRLRGCSEAMGSSTSVAIVRARARPANDDERRGAMMGACNLARADFPEGRVTRRPRGETRARSAGTSRSSDSTRATDAPSRVPLARLSRERLRFWGCVGSPDAARRNAAAAAHATLGGRGGDGGRYAPS